VIWPRQRIDASASAIDVARSAVFLANEFDGFITAATIDINGGSFAY
jgi:hypothetical protein